MKYGSYPQNADFDDLPIEYKQRLFTEQPIYCLTDNIVERLKVGSIKRSLDNKRYEGNNHNADFDYVPFDGDERLIPRRPIYCMNDDIVFRYINGSIIYV